jgi:hypothetical protein
MTVQQSVIYWHLESDIHIFFMTRINLGMIGQKKKYPESTQINIFLQKSSAQDISG